MHSFLIFIGLPSHRAPPSSPSCHVAGSAQPACSTGRMPKHQSPRALPPPALQTDFRGGPAHCSGARDPTGHPVPVVDTPGRARRERERRGGGGGWDRERERERMERTTRISDGFIDFRCRWSYTIIVALSRRAAHRVRISKR